MSRYEELVKKSKQRNKKILGDDYKTTVRTVKAGGKTFDNYVKDENIRNEVAESIASQRKTDFENSDENVSLFEALFGKKKLSDWKNSRLKRNVLEQKAESVALKKAAKKKQEENRYIESLDLDKLEKAMDSLNEEKEKISSSKPSFLDYLTTALSGDGKGAVEIYFQRDKAKEKTVLMETRSVMLALQTLSTEKYAEDGKGNYKLSDFSEEDVFKLADITGDVAELKDVTTDEKGKITFLRYTTTDGYNTTYTSAGYAISLDSGEEEIKIK